MDFKEKFEKEKIVEEDVKEEVIFGHTIFSIAIKKKSSITRLYIVACSPYQHDVDMLEDSEAILYKGKFILS